jgi:protein involved in polysaccharide export with SLBB domain/predicted RNA-binding protein YlxR (DUF448 family)
MKNVLLLILWIIGITSSWADASQQVTQLNANNSIQQVDNRVTSNQEVTQADQKQFSSLAYGNPTNTGNTSNTNIQFKTSASMGAIESQQLIPFGSNLFRDQCKNLRQSNFFNPEYRLTIGDKINLQMWGAFQFSQVLTVDAQGNIFLPEVGPIHLEGVKNKDLSATIQHNIMRIFKKGVHSYADLITAQPVQIYVTGFVNSPGLYDGLSSDSVIYYLCTAGGINMREGSFRNISLIRNGRQIHNIDLYDFLINGNIDQFQLHQGDTIVVKPQHFTVSVEGAVKHAYQYEWNKELIKMDELIKVVNPEATATFVQIQRNQGEKPKVYYKRIDEARDMLLASGDRLNFVADKDVKQVIVTVKGQIRGRHQYVMERGQTIDDLLKKVRFTKQANVENIQLYRESAKEQQKSALYSSLARLERQVLTSKPFTGDDAKAQALQSEMVMKFVNEAKNVELQGQVVLGHPSTWNQVLLENNDIINVPQYSSVVNVSGDVVNASSIEVTPGMTVLDYISAAGGFDKTANTKEFLVMRQNGQAFLVKNSRGALRQVQVKGGDQIIVLPDTDDSGLKLSTAVSQIVYQTALAARVIMRI